MKYKLGILIILSVIWTGCVTMPDAVDEAYLVEKTADESAKIEKIEGDVIAKKKSKDKIEKDQEIATQRVEVSRKEVKGAETAGDLLLEKEKLYKSTGDAKLADIQKQKEANNAKIAQAKAVLEYNIAKKSETDAQLELAAADLGLRVAELRYEKALIAKKYQMKRSKEFAKNMIDETEYQKFMENQKREYDESRSKHEKAAKALAEAEEKLKRAGYEVEK